MFVRILTIAKGKRVEDEDHLLVPENTTLLSIEVQYRNGVIKLPVKAAQNGLLGDPESVRLVYASEE